MPKSGKAPRGPYRRPEEDEPAPERTDVEALDAYQALEEAMKQRRHVNLDAHPGPLVRMWVQTTGTGNFWLTAQDAIYLGLALVRMGQRAREGVVGTDNTKTLPLEWVEPPEVLRP